MAVDLALVDQLLEHSLDRSEALLEPVAAGVPTTRAELVWAVTHEGALDLDDLLERRTRVGLVPADRAAVEPPAREALSLVGAALPSGQ